MTEEPKETKITVGRQLLRDLRDLMRQDISESNKLSLFSEDMIDYVENPIGFARKTNKQIY